MGLVKILPSPPPAPPRDGLTGVALVTWLGISQGLGTSQGLGISQAKHFRVLPYFVVVHMMS